MSSGADSRSWDLVRLHPGVAVQNGRLTDRATRRRLRLDETGADPAQVVGLGYGYVPRARLALAGAGTGRGRLRALRAVRMSFRRRFPGGSAWAGVLAVAAASRLPGAVMVGMFVLPALTLGLLFDAVAMTMRVGMSALVAFWVSLVVHESAHLVLLRAVERDRTVGAVMHSWTSVWIVGPDLGGWKRRGVAAAGPLAGIGAAVLLWYGGLPGYVCAGAGVVHAANLLPLAPDGRALLASR